MSNITAGNAEQIQTVIGTGILPPLIEVLVKVSSRNATMISATCDNARCCSLQGDFKAQKEAAWAVTNLTSGGSVEQIVSLCQAGVLRPFCDLMAAKDEKTVAVVLGKEGWPPCLDPSFCTANMDFFQTGSTISYSPPRNSGRPRR